MMTSDLAPGGRPDFRAVGRRIPEGMVVDCADCSDAAWVNGPNTSSFTYLRATDVWVCCHCLEDGEADRPCCSGCGHHECSCPPIELLELHCHLKLAEIKQIKEAIAKSCMLPSLVIETPSPPGTYMSVGKWLEAMANPMRDCDDIPIDTMGRHVKPWGDTAN